MENHYTVWVTVHNEIDKEMAVKLADICANAIMDHLPFYRNPQGVSFGTFYGVLGNDALHD